MSIVFKKLMDGIDVSHMVASLYEHFDLWDEIKGRQETPGSPHSETKTIFLRWAKELTIQAAFTDLTAVDYPARKLMPESDDLIFKFLQALSPTRLGRVIITQLKPFGLIAPHVDEGIVADSFQRFHIPISCGSASTFYGKTHDQVTECAKMKPGELWWFDNKRTHWVENMCDAPRVHMIFDAWVPGMEREYDRSGNNRNNIMERAVV